MSTNKFSRVPVGCNNDECREHQNCLRFEAWKENAIERFKRFNGSKEKGCGKFIAKR
jgi:hypothetical protein